MPTPNVWFSWPRSRSANPNTPGLVQPDGTTILLDPATGILSTAAGEKTATITLTAAQINGMFAAPIQIVAPQGAGRLIVVNRYVLNAIFGSAAFAGGGSIGLFYGSVSPPVSQAAQNVLATFLTGLAANSINSAGGQNGAAANTVVSSIAVNGGLFLSNATAPFTVGTGCTAVVTLSYFVLGGVS